MTHKFAELLKQFTQHIIRAALVNDAYFLMKAMNSTSVKSEISSMLWLLSLVKAKSLIKQIMAQWNHTITLSYTASFSRFKPAGAGT
jgi:hypothetical protein